MIFLAVRTPDDSCCWNKSILPLYCKWKYKPVLLKGRTCFDTIFAGLKLAVAFPDIRRKRDFRSFLGVYGCMWFVCWTVRTMKGKFFFYFFFVSHFLYSVYSIYFCFRNYSILLKYLPACSKDSLTRSLQEDVYGYIFRIYKNTIFYY